MILTACHSGAPLKKSVLADEFTWFTYQDMLNKIDDVATGLKLNYDLVPNDKVRIKYYKINYYVSNIKTKK